MNDEQEARTHLFATIGATTERGGRIATAGSGLRIPMMFFPRHTQTMVERLVRASIAAGLLVAVSIIAHAAEVKIAMKFLHARKMLIHKGWHPVQSKIPGEHIGVENILIRGGIKEAESCAIDRPLCIFNYSKNGKCLTLVTSGENVATMQVTDIIYSCSS